MTVCVGRRHFMVLLGGAAAAWPMARAAGGDARGGVLGSRSHDAELMMALRRDLNETGCLMSVSHHVGLATLLM